MLDALDAYRKKLVKKIEVKGFDIKNLRGTDGYLFLENIIVSPKKPPMARLEFEIGYDKSINRETRIVGVDDDLYALSKGMEQYRGYHINDIDPIKGILTFTNGVEIRTGESTGDVSEKDIRRVTPNSRSVSRLSGSRSVILSTQVLMTCAASFLSRA